MLIQHFGTHSEKSNSEVGTDRRAVRCATARPAVAPYHQQGNLLSGQVLRTRRLLLFFVIAGAWGLRAADGDWQTWTQASWTQNVGNALDASLRFEPRMTRDVSLFSYYEIEPALAWRYSPRWKFTLGYERDETIEPAPSVMHVPSLSTTLTVPVKTWNFSNVFRLEFDVPESSGTAWYPAYVNTSELATSWRMGSMNLQPYVFEETDYNLRDGFFFENHLGIGLGVPIATHWMARAYFMRLDEKTASGWEWHPVLGFQIAAKF